MSLVVLGPVGWRSWRLRPCLLFCYDLFLLPYLCCGLFIFVSRHFSFIVHPSVLDVLFLLVVVATSSSCSVQLRSINNIVIIKVTTYLLRGEVLVHFSYPNVDDCFSSTKERSSKDVMWIIIIFSHVND